MNLLDVNVLLALLWSSHPDFEVADKWFHANAKTGWATCALTQAGFIRISAQKSFRHSDRPIADIADGLDKATAGSSHRFLKIDFPFKTVRETCTGGVVGHRQITDAYLLTLAIKNKAKFISLDAGVRQLLATELERKRHLVILHSE